MAGRQTDMRPYYRDAALTLICSLKEGLALTAYESLAMGTPVVTSDVGGQAELVDASVGRVLPLLQSEAEQLDNRDFPAQEIRQYADAIQELIQKLLADEAAYAQMCAAGRRRIEEGFSSQCMIRRLEAALAECQSPARCAARAQTAQRLQSSPIPAGELAVLAGEIQQYEFLLKHSYASDTKNELMRIANSKWGRRAIKLAFKLKLNRLF
jgi:hypothetical protein